jgi:DNA-3-methyladenine glycosylase
MRLDLNFFHDKDSLTMAQNLLWKVLTKTTPNWIISGIINEVEAYRQDDEASHTYWWRKSERNEVMFRDAGHLYVYFTYGMYHCMNIVTEESGYGAAVLIRSVIPYKWEDLMIKNRKWQWKKSSDLVNWPAKVCLAYDISKQDNWINLLLDNSTIFLEDVGFKVPKVQVSKRIGISKWVDKDWRFWF